MTSSGKRRAVREELALLTGLATMAIAVPIAMYIATREPVEFVMRLLARMTRHQLVRRDWEPPLGAPSPEGDAGRPDHGPADSLFATFRDNVRSRWSERHRPVDENDPIVRRMREVAGAEVRVVVNTDRRVIAVARKD